ncbi:MAG TPA: DNA polymerase IV [Solirubrobacterales bacterium]
MSGAASILHADADAFFASVEQRDDPSLRGRPTIVGGGVVLAASYEARAHGIHSGMGGRRARQLCPTAIVVPARFDAYTEASRALFDLFDETAPLVEGMSLEEAFLDVRGLERISGTPRQIAERLRRRARERIGLAVTVGVARTKVLAKMASRAAKPDGLLVVEPGREEAFLVPLPVEALWGVGAVTAEKLRSHGISTIGQLGRRDEGELAMFLGGHAARHLHAIAHNRDPRRVRSGRRRRSIGTQSAFAGGGKDGTELDALLVTLVDRVTRRARAANRAGRTVTLRFRFADFSRATRSRTLPHPTAGTGAILAAGRALLRTARPMIERRGITLLGITVANLSSHAQLELPLEPRVDPALDLAIDEIRRRFGNAAIRRGSTRSTPPRHVTQV